MLGLGTDNWILIGSGVLVTLKLTLAASIIALVTAFLAAFAQMSAVRAFRWLATIHIEFWRGSSAVIQLFIVFYALPQFGIRLETFLTGALVLGLNIGAYGSQVVRAAIQNVPTGQSDASMALGLSRWRRMRLVILPQAIPNMLPTFGNESVELLKMTAATSLITLHDLAFVSRDIVQRDGQATLIYSLQLGIYFLMALPLLTLTGWLERRGKRSKTAPRTQHGGKNA